MKAIDFLDGADDLGSSQSAESFLDAAEPKKQNKGILGDIGTGLKRGVEQMPGMVTGIADIAAAPVSAITGINRPFSRAADYVGEKTGFQPAKWAEQAAQEYSPEMQQSLKAVEQADGFTGTLKAIGENPRSAVNLIAESLPSTLAGGILARGAMGAVVGAEKLAAMKAAGDTAGLMKAGAIAGGIGEGAVSAGQQMSQTDYNVDPLRAAGAATAAGIGTGIIGGISGRVANKLGLADIEGSIAAGTLGAGKKAGMGAYAGRIAGGAVQEGALEELPQSAQEQVWQNLANGKPWNEGVGKASAQGLVAGMAMGAGVNALPGSSGKQEAAPPIVPPARDSINLITDPAPLQGRIDSLLGIGDKPMSDAQRAQYAKDLEASFGEVVGYAAGADGLEVPVTMEDYLRSTLSAADMTRDKPLAAGANDQSANRLNQLADEEATQQPDIAPGYVPPVIPVVGPLSAIANAAVQSGAHQTAVMQQSAATATAPTKAAPQAGIMSGIAAQAQSPASAAPAINEVNSVNSPAPSISNLQDQLDKTEPFSEQSQLLTERLQLAVTDDAKSAIGTGEMPVYKVTDHVSVAIHPSAQKEGMIQVTRYTKDGVIGDSQYNSIDEAVRFEGLAHKPRIPSNEAIAHIENSIAAEAEYQKRKNEQQAGAGLPASTAGGSRPAPVADKVPVKNAAPSVATVSAETVAPSQEPIKNEDDWLGALFGAAPTAAESASKEVQTNRQAQDKADRVDSAIAMLTGEIEASNAAAAEVAARNYKSNRKQIELKGDGPGKNGSLSISAINESRKRRTVEALQNASSSIKQAIEFIAENPDAAFKQVADMEAAVTKQFNEGFFGPSAKLDGQLDMAVGSLIGSGSYSGEGSAGRKLRMAAHAYASVDAVSQPKTDAAPEAAVDYNGDSKEVGRMVGRLYSAFHNSPKGTGDGFNPISIDDISAAIEEAKKVGITVSKRTDTSYSAVWDISTPAGNEYLAYLSPEGRGTWKSFADNAKAAPEAKQEQAPAIAAESSQSANSEPDTNTRFSKNTIFTADKVAAAKARMKAKLGTLNSGIDPELLIDGMTIAGAYIESGVRKFSDYAKAMVEDLGDGVKPYLLSFYEAARAYPGLAKIGMDSQAEAEKQHQALLTPEVKEAAKEVIGKAPKVEKTKPANLGESVKLKADWGVKNIDGYTKSKTGKNQQTDAGLSGGVKDEFLADATRYLKAVEKLLAAKGFTAHTDSKGKPAKTVSTNEGGPAFGGDAMLMMRNGKFGIYADVGVTNIRGSGPSHPQGVSLMVRVTNDADKNKYGESNKWLAIDLTAGDLSAWFDKQYQAFAKRSAEVKPAAPAKVSYDLSKADDKFKVATEIADFLIGGGEFKTIIEARKKIAEMIDRPIEAATELAKQADETIETAVVMAGRDIVKAGRKQGRTPEVIYTRLVDLYRRQPNLAVRSSTSVRDQAYSTPVPLAYLASELAGITYDTKVLEPTAGNGMLLIGASVGNSVVNELNPDRADVLRSLGFNPTERNAATEQLRHAGYPVDAVIANPPFGATKDANGDTIIYDIKPGFKTREVDHAIVFKSLESMKDDGRAVLIVGGVQSEAEDARREDYRGSNKRSFYYNLYNEYNVIDHFTVDGGLYSKQGASYPVDIIVIDGRGKSSRDLPAANLPVIFKSYDSLKEKLNGNGRVESEPVVGANGTDSSNGKAGNSDSPAVVGSAVGSSVEDGNGGAGGVSAASVQDAGPTSDGSTGGSGPVSSGRESEPKNPSGSVAGVRVSNASRNAETGSEASNRGNRPADLGGVSVVNGERVESGLTDRRGKEQETGHQVAYDPHSNAASVGTLVPRAMKDSIAASLQKISDQVGSIDDYVAESLAMDVEDVKANFSAEQIDALALSIRNAEAGKGFIIGDQTGIGKGRVVAAMIRYALVTGKTPIFVTEKPNLYSDMIRDLDDIGMTAELALDTKNPKVLITNGGESIPYTLLRTENGEAVENNLTLRAPKAGKALDQYMQALMQGESLGDYKVIFTTYSQLQTVKGATTTRQKFIQQFGAGNYMVFDESHNAGGAGETQARSKEQRQAEKEGQSLVTGRAAFVRALVQKAFGTFFSSATYAKRPDVMDLYSSTNMKLAVDKISQLGEAIKAGGVPMQQVVANMLTKDGQYIRRERTFAGVSYDTQETKVDKVTAENMASAMRSILAFSRAKDSVIKEIQKEMDREGGMINEMGGEKSSVQGANFGSIMHNLIDQMLLSLKVQDSVSHAIERLKAGEKVVLTVSNTMGSFLKDYSEELGIATGDPVSMSFADLYNRYLEKQRNVTIKDGGGNKRQHRLTDAELGPRLVDMFNAVRKQIESSGFGSAPISPIDYMHNELRKAGYKTDEITGRTIALNYSSGTPILASRTANIRQRVKAVSGFNNGETDVLILNQAGSTGLSLHASSKFKDQRKRHMIIVQAEKNIDTHMQMLGRVHRTGQVVAPAYSQMMADIPAEMRPASVLMKKMASLNANTTASRTSSVTAEGVVDFMNDYGGQVVHEYLRDNPDVLEAVGGNKVISLADDPAEAGEDDIRKFTGYIPILPIKQQEEVYRELVDRYNELIERENSLGTNKLEAKAVDLDAETISSQTVTEDRGDPSVFASPANMEKVDVKRTVKPYSSEEVAAMVSESLDGKTANQVAATQLADLFDKATAYGKEKVAKMVADEVDPVKLDSQKAQLQLVLSHARTVLNTYKIGDSISVKDQIGQFVYGVITKIERSGRTANPAAGSAWKMHVALANGDAKSITLSFSQIGSKYELRAENRVEWYNTDTQSVERIPVSDIFDKGAKVRREKRWIVTGNILAGFARFPGQIITYTKKDGTTAQGVLMSRQFDFEKEQKNAPVRIKDGKSAIQFFTNGGQGGIIGTPDRLLMIAPRRGEFEITVPSSKKDGGTYYLDTGLTNIVGDFYKRGSIMSASVYTTGDVERVVDYLVKGREETIIALSNVEKAKELLEGNTGAGNIAAPGSMSPADKAIYGMAAEGKSAAEVLKFIASASRSPFNRQVARLLLKTGIAPSITVGDSKTWNIRDAKSGEAFAAAYDPKTNTVALFRPASAERNALHELIHAASLKALAKNGLASAQMKALFAHVEKTGKLTGMYGIRNVDEFIAEAFSNPKFQAALKQVSAAPVGGKPSSVWDRFVRIVRGILGLKQGQDNALSQALEIGIGVMRENMALQSGDGVIRFNHALRSNPEGNRPLNAIRLANLRRIAAGLERTKDAVFLRVTEDGKAITTGPKGVRIPETFIRFAETNGLDFEARRNGEGRKSDGHTIGEHITSKTEPMPEEYRESGALYFGEGNEFFDRTGKTRYNAAPGKINRTDTEVFRKWFGKSAVVNANGEPLVVYHGTGSEFTKFSSDKANYFTASQTAAGYYAEGFGENRSGRIMPVYLSISNPKILPLTESAKLTKEDIARYAADGFDGVFGTQSEYMWGDKPSIAVLQDGRRVTEAVPFSPTQIKSAIGNYGDFDGSNPDIRYNVAPGNKSWSVNNYQKRADQLDRAFTAMGLESIRESSRASASEYVAVQDPNNEETTYKFRVSNHRLPSGYAQPDFDVIADGVEHDGAMWNASGTWIDAVNWISDKTGKEPRGIIKAMAIKRRYELDSARQAEATEREKVKAQYSDQNNRIIAEKIKLSDWLGYLPDESTLAVSGKGKLSATKPNGEVVLYGAKPFGMANSTKTIDDARKYIESAPTHNSAATRLPGAPDKVGMQKRSKTEPAQSKSGAGSDANVTDGVEYGNSIRYNVADEGWSITEPSRMDDVIYALQDKQIDMKRVMQSIMKTGKQIRDSLNPYLQEELFHGRASKGVKDFLDFELRPLLKQMQDAKVDMGDFEEYLWNRHAEERNQQIAKINPEMQDGGSGIETAKARAYLAGLTTEQRKTFEALAGKVYAMNKASQKVLVESGLENQETIDAWNGAYRNYVPLQREDVDSGHAGTGKGFSVRGSSTKRAMGSGKKVVDIIANITMQRERNIVRAEKNRVSNALMGLAVTNPNPDFWTVDKAPKERVVEEKAIYTVMDGEGRPNEFTRMSEAQTFARSIPGATMTQTWGDRVTERVVPGFTSRDNVLLTRINGKDHYIIFNERDERAMRMATAMKNLDMDNLGRVLSIVGKATRYLASINTQYNPVFGVINLIRDAQGALINLSSTPLAGEQKRVLGYTKDALVGIYKDIRAHRAGKVPSSKWAALFEEFQKEGGQTGYRDQYANAEARAEAIVSELEQFKEGKAKQLTRGVFGWLSDYNETMENATRLAAYKAAKEKGMSNQQAASLAKNITVNFNRKGQMATQVGALYAFFNASVQGTARIAETLFDMKDGNIRTARLSKTGKKIMVGGIMLGSMQALLLAAAGFGDDEPPEFVRERNLILPIGDGKYLTLAMPLGFHVIPGIGRIATEFVLSGGKDPLKKLASFGSMFADSFNPIGSAGWSLQTITPSIVDPFAALAENRDFTGKEIYRKDFNALNPTPGHDRAKDVATVWSRYISETLNFVTGGSEFKPGLVSWSPDAIDYLIGQATGGVGRELNKAFQSGTAAATGEELPIYKIPLVGRFVGDTTGQGGQSSKFYDAIKQINMHEAEYKGLIKDGRQQEAREYMAENPATRLMLLGNHAERTVQKLRSAKRDLVDSGADSEQVRVAEERITATMRLFNERVAAAI